MDVEVFSYCEEKSYFLLPDNCTEFDEEPRNSTIFITQYGAIITKHDKGRKNLPISPA